MVGMGLYTSEFSKEFSRLLNEAGVTRYRIAQYTGLDQGYLGHLMTGVKANPSPETIVRISIALAHESKGVNQHDIERLFSSVGRSLFRKRARSNPYE
ncbi:helix-turn-helix domain-containing protein [Chloroflexota bacterium]